jgi:N-acetylmuramoyl-L-alanine amidase
MKKWQFFFVALIMTIISFGGVVSAGYILSQEQKVVSVATPSEIRAVQQRLNEFGYYYGYIDGVYNESTKSAVIRFQRDYGLNAEGYIGPLTLQMLGISTYSEAGQNSDIYLLAKCIYGESRGESYVGQVAVAAVILNRVKHPSFPNTIAGVVYQPWAFTAVFDGQINLEPNQSAYSAAQDAMNGWDPTYGCIYYYNPVTATNKWIRSREIVLEIGKHVFAK